MQTQGHKIVVVCDTPIGAELEKSFFQRRGFQVLTAINGLEALALVTSHVPDVVILKQATAGLTGIDVCSRLKASELTREIPVVLVGADDTEGVRQACLASGVDAFVPSSAGRAELLQLVARILHIPARRSARITVLFAVEGGEKEALGRAVELSQGGMRLEVDRPYEDGTHLKVRFMLPSEREEIRVGARVCWVRQGPKDTYAVGLEFTDLPDRDRRRLISYIDKRLSGPDSEASPMTLRGSLARISFPDLLRRIQMDQRTGCLRLEHDKINTEIYFHEGCIIACSTDDPPKLLGQFLLFRGFVSKDLLRRAMAQHEATGKALREILVEMGAVSSDALAAVAAAKAEETIFSLFDCDEQAVFDFTSNVSPHPRATGITLEVETLLLRRMKRVNDREGIQRVLNPRAVLVHTVRWPPAEALGDWCTRQIYLAVNGERTVEEIILHVHGTEFLVMECLFGLHKSGFIEIAMSVACGDTSGSDDSPSPALPSRSSLAGPEVAGSSTKETAAVLPPAEISTEPDLEMARRLIASANYEAGLELLKSIHLANPHDTNVRRLLAHAEGALLIQLTNEGLSPFKVPVPARSRDDIAREEVSPEEDFLLNLSDGTWDIRSLTYISPMRALDVLVTLTRLSKRGLIELRDPEKLEAVLVEPQASGVDLGLTGLTDEEIERVVHGGGKGAA